MYTINCLEEEETEMLLLTGGSVILTALIGILIYVGANDNPIKTK